MIPISVHSIAIGSLMVLLGYSGLWYGEKKCIIKYIYNTTTIDANILPTNTANKNDLKDEYSYNYKALTLNVNSGVVVSGMA